MTSGFVALERLEVFRTPKFALKVLGFWPKNNLTLPRIIHGMINLIILSWAVGTEFGWGIAHISTPVAALDAVAPALSKAVVVLKLSTMWIFRERFRVAINRIDQLLNSEFKQNKHQVLNRSLRLAGTLGLGVFLYGNTANTIYGLRPFVNNVYRYFSGRNTTRDVPFVAWLPFEAHSLGLYTFVYLLNAYFGFICVFGFGGVDGLFVQCCMYMSALFENCGEDLKEVFNKKPEEELSCNDMNVTHRKLSKFIAKHIEIMDLSAEIFDLFTLIIMAHFISAALVIGITVVDLITATGFSIVVYAVHSSLTVFELFVYCIGGSKIVDCSTDVANAVYFQEWYRYDVQTQKMIVLIMVRAQRGTCVQVPFFTPSIQVFGAIMGTAFSYITIAKTFI